MAGDSCQHDAIELYKNVAIETVRHPRESEGHLQIFFQLCVFFFDVPAVVYALRPGIVLKCCTCRRLLEGVSQCPLL